MLKDQTKAALGVVALVTAFSLFAFGYSQPPLPSGWVAESQPKQHAQREQSAPRGDESTAQQLAPIDKDAANGQREPAKAEPKHDEDSFQHWGASDWIAVIATLVALLQFAALVVTIIVMRRSARMEQRAYLSIANSSVEFDPATKKFRVMIVFQNSGNTPAYDCVIELHMTILDRYQPITARFTPQEPPAVMYALIGPHSSFTGSDALALDGGITIEQIKERDKLIYVMGRVDYEDIFKNRRWLKFRTFVRELPGKGWVLMPSTNKGNDADR